MASSRFPRSVVRWTVALSSVSLLALVGFTWVLPLIQKLGKQADGSYLVPTNQIVAPAGLVRLTQYARPKDLAISPDGNLVAVLCTDGVRFYTRAGADVATVKTGVAAMGVCWSADGKTVFASGSDGKVHALREGSKGWAVAKSFAVDVAELAPAKGKAGNPQVLGLAAASDGKTLYVALGIRNSVAEVDIASEKVVRYFKVGAAPYRILLVESERKLFAANRGGEPAKPGEQAADSAGTAIAVDPISDGAARGSVSIVDLQTAKVESVVVGKHPFGMAFAPNSKTLYVAESDADTVGVVDVATRRRVGEIRLNPVQDLGFGMMPNGLALSPDGETLYVACGGANAVAVVELGGNAKLKGYVPTGWYPVAATADNRGLVIGCSKGVGARPDDKSTNFRVHDSVGMVQFAAYGDLADLRTLTERVAANNRWEAEPKPRKGVAAVPVPERVGEPSVFKHVVYVIKENLTYDVVLGDIQTGNGDPNLCIFGEGVTPNHHRLARQFVLLDNTYTSGTNSADGHQWTSSAVCNGYQEQNYGASQRSYPYDGGDPLACSPKGFLWTAVHRKGLSVRVYGEYVNRPTVVDRETGKTPGFFDFWDDYVKKGNRYKVTAETDNAALRPFLHPNYIGFPTMVPDQWRADRFLEDFDGFVKNDSMPALCMLLLPNNHTSGTSSAVPTPRAMVADNDLALGRIVEAVSKSKYWKDTLIVVIEDDSQNGLDHVDGHRTAAFCISAYTKRGAVVSLPYNHTSVIRTIELVLGVPSMTRFDQSAAPLRECFQSERNLAPYYCAKNLVPLDERNPKKSAMTKEQRRLTILCEQQDWRNYDRADPRVVSMAAWYSQRPHQPFPASQFKAIEDDD